MVEDAIVDMDMYPTRMELYRSLPRKVQYQTFRHILEYLETNGRIIFNDDEIIFTGINNEKLRALVEESKIIRRRT